MSRIDELRALHDKATSPDGTVAQVAQLEEAVVAALPDFLELAEAAKGIQTLHTVDYCRERPGPCPRCRFIAALAKLETP